MHRAGAGGGSISRRAGGCGQEYQLGHPDRVVHRDHVRAWQRLMVQQHQRHRPQRGQPGQRQGSRPTARSRSATAAGDRGHAGSAATSGSSAHGDGTANAPGKLALTCGLTLLDFAATRAIRMWPLGAMLGAIRANDFPHQADGYGQAGDVHASSRTDPDNAERLTGIYGSDARTEQPCVDRCDRATHGPQAASAHGH